MQKRSHKWVFYSLFVLFILITYRFFGSTSNNEELEKQVTSKVGAEYLVVEDNRAQNSEPNVMVKPVEKAISNPSPQVQIPTGASSMESMIHNFEQEKKLASKLAHENPFKPNP